MSNQSFKVKNGLTLTPVDLTTLVSPQAGDLACDINDSNKIKRYDANASAWTEVGSGGVGGTDILFVQDFESASPSSFTQVGLTLSQTDPLHGRVSALLTHDASVNQLFKQVIPVDNKFRNQTMVLRLDVKSNASAGNVVINIYDETNAANIVASEQLQLSNDVNGTKNSVGFTIPETCASLSYTITALPEAGSPVTRIDDIICELAETALLETAVEVPVVTAWQGYTPTFQGFGTSPTGPTNIEFEWRQVGENVEIRGKFTSGTSTAVEARVGLPAGLTSAGTAIIPSIQVVGKANAAVNNTTNFGGMSVLIEPSTAHITFGRESSTINGTTKANGDAIIAASGVISFFASVPCAGLSATSTKTIPLTQSGLVQEGDSFILTRGNAGQSITANVTNIPFIAVSSKGSKISFTGSTFSVSETGIYHIDGSIAFNSNGGSNIYLYADGVRVDSISSESNLSIYKLSQSRELQSGINYSIRTSRSGTLDNISAVHYLIVSYQGSLKQIAVSSDQKLRIPTSELRFEGASSRGSTATAIVKFDTIAKIRGDAFTVESDSVLGTRITMKKAGKLDINMSILAGASTAAFLLTKNQIILTTNVISAAETLASINPVASSSTSMSYSGYVQIGDVIRVAAGATPVANVLNQLNLSFQEQDISVSVTNTLPQFSESDSCVRVDTANGYGSSGTRIRRFSNTRDNIGTDIQYVPSDVNGDSFVAKASGIYNVSYSDTMDASGQPIGISKNASSLITNIVALNAAERLAISSTTDASGYAETVSWQGYLVEGDIIRAHTSAGANTANTGLCHFTISKVGKPNVTGVDVTPFVNVPQPVSQSVILTNTSVISGSTNLEGLTKLKSINSGIFSLGTSGVLVLKPALFTTSLSSRITGSVNFISAEIRLNGTLVASAANQRSSGSSNSDSSTFSASLVPGDLITFSTSGTENYNVISITAEALSDQILTAPETFSTDTASLTYAGSGTYTLSTLANAPVGTYITFTYAGGGNARSQTTGLNRPTQTDADMNANGILIYSRVFSVGSSSSQPAAIAIQIGKGMKGKTIDLYKSAGKLISGSTDKVIFGVAQRGLAYQSYDEKTGILFLDAGECLDGGVTTHNFMFSDSTTQTSGYLVINASKNPALTGLGLNRVAARATSTAGGAIGTTATLQTFSEEVFDTNGAWNGNTFTAPETGYYQVSAGLMSAVVTIATGGGFVVDLYKNGAVYSTSRSIGNGAANIYQAIISDVMFLRKDDTISLYSRSSVATTQNTTAGYNFISISKVSV